MPGLYIRAGDGHYPTKSSCMQQNNYNKQKRNATMPTDNYFGFSVLVAGRPVPEYVHNGHAYVESNLYTPFSYNQEIQENVNGELETQKCPVTPYQLFIHLAPHCEASVLFIYVDGVRVTKLKLEKGNSKIVQGFNDKDGIREFLFALPRFAANREDKLDKKRQSKIGTIEVVRCEASYLREEYRAVNDTHFNQANKKDAFKVTEGKYTMSTTKKGRYLHRAAPYDVQLKKLWKVGAECGRLTINYRMGHTLEDMGIELKPTDWSKVIVRRSASPSTSSSSSPPASPTEAEARDEPEGSVSNPSSPEPQSPAGSPKQTSLSPSPPTVIISGQVQIKCEPKDISYQSDILVVN